MKNPIKTIIVVSIIVFPVFVKAQNWFSNNYLKQTSNIGTECPTYNFGDSLVVVDWQHALGTNGDNWAYDIDYAPDSNYVMLFLNYGYYCFYFAKYNSAGEELWKHALMYNDSIKYSSHEYVRLGNSYYLPGYWTDSVFKHFGILKTNSYGEKLWIRELYADSLSSLKYTDYVNPRVIKVENNNMLLSIGRKNNLQIVKIDSAANIIWELTEKDLDYDPGTSFRNLRIILSDDTYTLYYRCNYWKVSKNGDLISFGGFGEFCHTRLFYFNGRYYACGFNATNQCIRKYSKDFILESEYLLKINDQKIISDAADIKMLSDNSVLVYYDFEYLGNMNGDVHHNIDILHLDKDLSCIKNINLYAYGMQEACKLLLDSNQDYILFGDGYYSYNERNMILLVKLQGESTVDILTNKVNQQIQVFPNPFPDKLNISSTTCNISNIIVYNLLGTVVLFKENIDDDYLSLNLEHLAKGMYTISFQTNNSQVITKKIIKK